MDKLREIKDSNAYFYPEDKLAYLEYCHKFQDDVITSVKRQFVYEEAHTEMRLSMLGKCSAFELLAKKLGKIPLGGKDSGVNEQLKLIFLTGDFVESYILFLCRRIGYTVWGEQRDVNWNGVRGHIDAMITDDDGIDHLLEIKSANDWYFSQTVKAGFPGDERGYLTQLLTYADGLNIPRENVHWVFVNKNNSEIAVLDLASVPDDIAESRLKRAKSIVDAYNKCDTDEDLYRLVQPPPASIEKTKDGKPVLNPDGSLKLYAPSTIGHPDFCYITEWGKTKWGKKRLYVTDYNYPEEFQKYKPNIVEVAKRYDV